MSYWEQKRIDGAMEMLRGYAGQSQRADREIQRAKRPMEMISPDSKDYIIDLHKSKKAYNQPALKDLFFKDPFTDEDVRKPGDRYIDTSFIGVMERTEEAENITIPYVMTTFLDTIIAGNAGEFFAVDITRYTKQQKEGDVEVNKRTFSGIHRHLPMYWTDGDRFLDPDNRQFDTPEFIRVFELENRIRIYKPELATNAHKSSVHIDLGCYR